MTESYTINYNWPGWPLVNNKFGDEFDEDARMRMVHCSSMLVPYILKYKKKLDGHICEIGPFFNPLVNHEEIRAELTKNSKITFFENDPYAIDYVKANVDCHVLDVDLNRIFERQIIMDYPFPSRTGSGLFDVIIISQVLNYVDYRNLLNVLYLVLKPNGLIFINNSVDYGLPQIFSEKRPRSNDEVIDTAEKIGYKIIERLLLPKNFEREIMDRLILILSK